MSSVRRSIRDSGSRSTRAASAKRGWASRTADSVDGADVGVDEFVDGRCGGRARARQVGQFEFAGDDQEVDETPGRRGQGLHVVGSERCRVRYETVALVPPPGITAADQRPVGDCGPDELPDHEGVAVRALQHPAGDVVAHRFPQRRVQEVAARREVERCDIESPQHPEVLELGDGLR
ncbi:MAG: hypothetical protein V9G12_15915 [Microthrixaceae bacterium]